MVNATIPHMLQSSHEALRDSEVNKATIRAPKTMKASAPGTRPPAMTAFRWSLGGDGSQSVFDAFSASTSSVSSCRKVAELAKHTQLIANDATALDTGSNLLVQWNICAQACLVREAAL